MCSFGLSQFKIMCLPGIITKLYWTEIYPIPLIRITPCFYRWCRTWYTINNLTQLIYRKLIRIINYIGLMCYIRFFYSAFFWFFVVSIQIVHFYKTFSFCFSLLFCWLIIILAIVDYVFSLSSTHIYFTNSVFLVFINLQFDYATLAYLNSP